MSDLDLALRGDYIELDRLLKAAGQVLRLGGQTLRVLAPQ